MTWEYHAPTPPGFHQGAGQGTFRGCDIDLPFFFVVKQTGTKKPALGPKMRFLFEKGIFSMHMASYYLKLNLRGGSIWITRHPQKLASLPVIPCNWSSSKENLQSAARGHDAFFEGARRKKHPQQNGNSNNRFTQTFHTKNKYTIQHNNSSKKKIIK